MQKTDKGSYSSKTINRRKNPADQPVTKNTLRKGEDDVVIQAYLDGKRMSRLDEALIGADESTGKKGKQGTSSANRRMLQMKMLTKDNT